MKRMFCELIFLFILATLNYCQNADPTKTCSNGKTSLGEAAFIGNVNILKLILDSCKSVRNKSHSVVPIIKTVKLHERKHKLENPYDETIVKYKTPDERILNNEIEKRIPLQTPVTERNQGYFVIVHTASSSSDERKTCGLSQELQTDLTTEAELEWDDEMGNVAPTTVEDELCATVYQWYAGVLESIGLAISAASGITNGIDQQDLDQKTALHYASEMGHIRSVKLLINAGCNLNVTTNKDLTPLHLAVFKNHFEIVKILLGAGARIHCQDDKDRTPLHFASIYGYLDLVRILIKYGAVIEARDLEDCTPLYLAAKEGHIHVVKYLIKRGANVNVETLRGYTALCEAVWNDFPEIVETLLASGARITHWKLLHRAIFQRSQSIAIMLCNVGAAINLCNEYDETPLGLAVSNSMPVVTKVLLKNGADVNLPINIVNHTALHVAVHTFNEPKVFEEIFLQFLEYNVDLNARTQSGSTPLNKAILNGNVHAARLLILHGADVNLSNFLSTGEDNLSLAMKKDLRGVASLLIHAGHYMNKVNFYSVNWPMTETACWVYDVCKRPLRLKDICRIRIRRMAQKRNLHRFTSLLPLPNLIKSYLMIDNEEELFHIK